MKTTAHQQIVISNTMGYPAYFTTYFYFAFKTLIRLKYKAH